MNKFYQANLLPSILKIATICLLAGRAWQFIFWDVTLRAIFWDESLVSRLSFPIYVVQGKNMLQTRQSTIFITNIHS